jgi:chorismate mutase
MHDKLHIPIDDAPEHAAALGRLLGHWAILERLLIHIMQWLLDTNWYKAMLVYQEFNSTRGKIVLLRRLNHHFNRNEPIRNKIDKHLDQALKLNTKRNAFIHSLWGVKTENSLARLKTISPPDHKKIENTIEQFTPQDIQNVVEEISKLSQSLLDLINQALAVLPEP